MDSKFEFDNLMCDEIKNMLSDHYRLIVRVSVYDGYDHLLREDIKDYPITNMYGALIEYHRRVNIYRKRHVKALVELQVSSDYLFTYNTIIYDVC